MNKKGFTLIELLAVIALLAILMTIAVPNIISTINNKKRDTFLFDAKRLVSKAEYLISMNKEDRDKVKNGEVKKYTFTELNKDLEFETDADSGKYDDVSFVNVSFDTENNIYKYCICLVGSKRKIANCKNETNSCLNSNLLTGIDVVKDK